MSTIAYKRIVKLQKNLSEEDNFLGMHSEMSERTYENLKKTKYQSLQKINW